MRHRVKKLNVLKKVFTELFYKLAQGFVKKYIMRYYNPIVLGIENIPNKKGADVYICNHRDIKDPLVMIALSKNPIHFAALKRMFEYRENMFGTVGRNMGTFFTTVFVKFVGALPIARSTDKDYMYTNLQTFEYINGYLKCNSSIGIYPEGTINRQPEKDGNIITLKSSRAFKIAENGKGVIRPVAIIWIDEKIKIKNKVIISFLKPIRTEGLRGKEIEEVWKDKITKTIDLMDNMVEEIIKFNSI